MNKGNIFLFFLTLVDPQDNRPGLCKRTGPEQPLHLLRGHTSVLGNCRKHTRTPADWLNASSCSGSWTRFSLLSDRPQSSSRDRSTRWPWTTGALALWCLSVSQAFVLSYRPGNPSLGSMSFYISVNPKLRDWLKSSPVFFLLFFLFVF